MNQSLDSASKGAVVAISEALALYAKPGALGSRASVQAPWPPTSQSRSRCLARSGRSRVRHFP